MTNITYGIMFAALAVVSVVVFLFNIKALKRLSVLDGLSKAIAVIIACVSLGSMGAFSWFSFENFTYRPPKQDELTKQLQKQIEEVKQTKSKYVQRISSEDYMNLSGDDLYKRYSKEGQRDIDNLAKQSTLTKDLFLRNVGRQFKAGGIFTTKLKATSGTEIDMLDGKNRVIAFVDGTEYSAKVLGQLRNYIQENKSDVELVMFFPITSGTAIDEFFDKFKDYTGPEDQALIVSSDSMSNMSNLNVKYVAVEEYKIQNLPSYVAIDSESIVSNVGVGTLIESKEGAQAWFNKAFTSETKYYERIQDAKQDASDSPAQDDSDTTQSESNKGQNDSQAASNSGEGTSAESNEGKE